MLLPVVAEMAVEFLIKNHCECAKQHRTVRILVAGDRPLCRITRLQINAQMPIFLTDLRSLSVRNILIFLLFYFELVIVL